MSYYFRFYFLIFFCAFITCRHSETLEYKKYESGVNTNLYSIAWQNQSTIIIAGGKTWYESTIVKSSDKGIHWKQLPIDGRGIYSICKDKTENIYGCGLDKKIYLVKDQAASYNLFGDYIFFRSMAAWSSKNMFMCGGEAFRIGYIYKVSLEDNNLTKVFEIERELNVIHVFDSLKWLAAGFGIVLSTNNGGMSWDTVDVSGDHFTDICFIQDSIGYLCGIGGSIFKTRNYGKSWTILRDASSAFISNEPFHCICFKDENNGFVAGESGIVWKTEDGGKNWNQINELPCVNYYDIQFHDGEYWLCGAEGTILSIKN